MKLKSAALIIVCFILIWIFGGGSGYPDLHEIYGKESDFDGSPIPAKPAARVTTTSSSAFSNITQFETWQSDTRSAYRELLKLTEPSGSSSNVEIIRSMPEKSGIVREYFHLESSDGLRIPGVLQYPKAAKALPAVLVIPGHTKAGDSGLGQLVDEQDSYQHAAATRLAQAGYVTISIELRGFGMLGPPNYPEHKIVAYNQLIKGSTYKALVLGDLLDSLRFLKQLAITDSSRIGVAGASLGGELSVALGALEPSIKTIAFSSYFDGGAFKPFGANSKQPHYCHIIPNIGSIMRKEDVFKLLAPRASIGIRDVAYEDMHARTVSILKDTWKLYNRADSFEFIEVVGGAHSFYVEETIEFFKENL